MIPMMANAVSSNISQHTLQAVSSGSTINMNLKILSESAFTLNYGDCGWGEGTSYNSWNHTSRSIRNNTSIKKNK